MKEIMNEWKHLFKDDIYQTKCKTTSYNWENHD
jgi:hypothetical protein